MTATAPGKLIVTGEYAVLDGAPALVVAMDRRVVARFARRDASATPSRVIGSSPFLLALAREIEVRYGAEAAARALSIVVDSSSFYDGARKLGLGSSAAVTVAATALALAASAVAATSAPAAMTSQGTSPQGAMDASAMTSGTIDRRAILAIADAAHAQAQGAMGARGSGADIASAVYGGAIVFTRSYASTSSTPTSSTPTPASSAAASDPASNAASDVPSVVKNASTPASSAASDPTSNRASDVPSVVKRTWPHSVRIVPFFTGVSASTTDLVARVSAARTNNPIVVDAALAAIADASRAACKAITAPADLVQTALIAALSLGGSAIDRLAIATGVDLVPPCVTAARAQMLHFGGTAKTTGAGGGDIGIAVIPATADVTEVRLALIQAGCQVLQLSVDETGVDLQTNAQ
ncbi:MAG: hypothetical protein ACKV2T_23020 [Kofleriaceae bacterium]